MPIAHANTCATTTRRGSSLKLGSYVCAFQRVSDVLRREWKTVAVHLAGLGALVDYVIVQTTALRKQSSRVAHVQKKAYFIAPNATYRPRHYRTKPCCEITNLIHAEAFF